MNELPVHFRWDKTSASLRDLLTYNDETGDFHWRVRPNGRVSNGQIAGSRNKDGYLNIKIGRVLYCAHRLAWLYVYGCWPDGEIDHRDGRRDNNAIANLRVATRRQQMANLKRPSTNTSGFKGVSFYKPKKRWRAYIAINGKPKHLGYFKTPELAHAAYVAAALTNRGEFARCE